MWVIGPTRSDRSIKNAASNHIVEHGKRDVAERCWAGVSGESSTARVARQQLQKLRSNAGDYYRQVTGGCTVCPRLRRNWRLLRLPLLLVLCLHSVGVMYRKAPSIISTFCTQMGCNNRGCALFTGLLFSAKDQNSVILCAQNFAQNCPPCAELTKRHRNYKILQILFSSIALTSALSCMRTAEYCFVAPATLLCSTNASPLLTIIWNPKHVYDVIKVNQWM